MQAIAMTEMTMLKLCAQELTEMFAAESEFSLVMFRKHKNCNFVKCEMK
jgi:hypothetical protein